VPNGLDHERYRPGMLPAEEDLVVFVGRLEHYKGVDLLLDAWPRVLAARPGARLVIVGEGTAGAAMRARATGGPFRGSVTFTGFLSESDKIGWLQRAAVLVQPSRKEGWGLTVLEANACGTPVVATDVPGLRDSVRHGVSGLLAAPNAVSLGASLVAVLGDPALRERLAWGARAWAGRFTWERVSDAFAEVVRAAAERRPLPEVPDFLASADGAGDAVGDPGDVLPGRVRVSG
jgi:glycosyltransferase involved in cell wall biosynthesis